MMSSEPIVTTMSSPVIAAPPPPHGEANAVWQLNGFPMPPQATTNSIMGSGIIQRNPDFKALARRKMSVVHPNPLFPPPAPQPMESEASSVDTRAVSSDCSANTQVATLCTTSVTTSSSSMNNSIYCDGTVLCCSTLISSSPYSLPITSRSKAASIDLDKPSTVYGAVADEVQSAIVEKEKSQSEQEKGSPSKAKQNVINPQVLEQHISKIISENAAIVETLDPLWSKRYMRHGDGRGSNRRYSSFEFGGSRSKLQSALLGGSSSRRISEGHLAFRHALQKSSTAELDPAVQNPEGSIIKDLLLKSRGSVSLGLKQQCDDAAEHVCPTCKIAFRSRENLRAHHAHYCKGSTSTLASGEPVSVITMAKPATCVSVGVASTSSTTPLKKRKFSEPAFLHHSSPMETNEPVTTTGSVCSDTPVAPNSSATVNIVCRPSRPTSLALPSSSALISSQLISPDTPRPRKRVQQLYLNGYAYTYLGLKVSTRPTYCCIYRPQPMFVFQSTDPKLSMYSNWQVVPYKDEFGVGQPLDMIPCYDSRQFIYSRGSVYTVPCKTDKIYSKSTYWVTKQQRHKEERLNAVKKAFDSLSTREASESASQAPSRKQSAVSEPGSEFDASSTFTDESYLDESLYDGEFSAVSQDEGCDLSADDSGRAPKRIKIFEGGYKSNEDYTYVRGRGRGKYVCEECGIRCKKPSMLKKHIRTHTDLRPYSCKHCAFAFKTKGNLTKHMKSKAHHKKCVELGIVPVPTTIDDSQIDLETLAKQEQHRRENPGVHSDEEDDDDEEDEDTDSEDEDKKTPDQQREHEAARSLLDLSSCGPPQSSLSSNALTVPSEMTSHPARRKSSATVPPPLISITSATSQSVVPVQGHIPPSLEANPNTVIAVNPIPAITVTAAENAERGNIQLVPVQLTNHTVQIQTFPECPRPRSYSMDMPRTSISKVQPEVMAAPQQLVLPPEEDPFAVRRYSMSSVHDRQPSQYIHGCASSSREGQCKDQPIDLRVARSRKIEILPGGIVSDGSFIRGPFPSVVQQHSPVLQHQVHEDDNFRPRSDSDGTASLLGTCLQYGSSTATSTLRKSSTATAVSSLPTLRTIGEDGGYMDVPVSDVPQLQSQSQSVVVWPTASVSAPIPIQPNQPLLIPHSMPSAAASVNPGTSSTSDEGRTSCPICNKSFQKPSQLRMHVNIHYFERPFERPFRCDNCAVSFRTRGHLQKHRRSVSHFNRVNMNMTFGTPSADNPRPFKCDDCKIAFRIHGHLAKHLRSKMHIMKLECLGKLPFGMYAELERSGANLNDIDTSDCENSLESLQVLAQRLYQQEPCSLRWKENLDESSTYASGGEEDDCGEDVGGRLVEQPQPPHLPQQQPKADTSLAILQRTCTCHLCGRTLKSAKSLQVHLHCDHGDQATSSGAGHQVSDVVTMTPVVPVVAAGGGASSTTYLNQMGSNSRGGHHYEQAQYVATFSHPEVVGGSGEYPAAPAPSLVAAFWTCTLCNKQFASDAALQENQSSVVL